MKLNQKLKKKRGVVLMVTLTTLVFLIVVIQQMAFDSSLEFRNEVSHYHGTRAYYSAKAGLELSLLKLSLYRKALALSEQMSGQVNQPVARALIEQAKSQAYLIWKPPLHWPPLVTEGVAELRQSEIDEMIGDSFLKDVSYRVRVESEESKFNMNDLASPHFQIRTWAIEFLNNLLINFRNQSAWLSYHYSEVDLRELVNQISIHLDPVSTLTQNVKPLNRRLINLNELLLIENFKPELLEILKPYITIHSSGGIHLQFASPLLIQSLSRNLTQSQIEPFLQLLDIENNLEAVFLNSSSELDQLFQQTGLSVLSSEYMEETNDQVSLSSLVFRFDAPQNFQIISTGFSGKVSKSISVLVHDPYFSIKRAFDLMDIYRQKRGSQNPNPNPNPNPSNILLNSPSHFFNPSTPFIIEWKDVN